MSDAIIKIRQVLLSPEYQGREKLILCILLAIAKEGEVECEREWLQKATAYSQKRLDARLEYMARVGWLRPLKCPESEYRYRLTLKT